MSLYLGKEKIPGVKVGGGSTQNAVTYDKQTPTETQQTQARENLDVMGKEEVSSLLAEKADKDGIVEIDLTLTADQAGTNEIAIAIPSGVRLLDAKKIAMGFTFLNSGKVQGDTRFIVSIADEKNVAYDRYLMYSTGDSKDGTPMEGNVFATIMDDGTKNAVMRCLYNAPTKWLKAPANQDKNAQSCLSYWIKGTNLEIRPPFLKLKSSKIPFSEGDRIYLEVWY